MSVLKSVRLSDECVRLIEGAPGNSFTEKLERIVLDYPSKTKEIKNLDVQIKTKYDEMKRVQNQIYKLRSIGGLTEKLVAEVTELCKM